MIEIIEQINSKVNDFIWGVPTMICIIGVGLWLSFRTGFVRIRKFGIAMKETIGRMFHKEDAAAAAVTPFQAVCTALAATVGTGNIAHAASDTKHPVKQGYFDVFEVFCDTLIICTLTSMA